MAVKDSNSIAVREMEIPRNLVFRMLAGLVIIAISIVFILTIILAIPGVFGLLIGFLVMYAGLPKKKIECYACGESFGAKATVKNPKCDTCETVNPIRWVKSKK